MSKIKTLVYLDLEATGLRSSGRPRISEISFVAVNSEDVEELYLNIQNHLKDKKNQDYSYQIESLIPRILNKLTLCVYPMATVMPDVTDITGLDNYNLNDQTRFDANTGHLLNNFLARLPSPVCLVAHNGNVYDYPLFKAEMEKAGIQVGSDILCADSYIGIKAIFQNRTGLIEAVDAEKKQTAPQSFSLINLHKHLIGCKPTRSHGAEADCLALLRTTSALGNDWLDWVEKNCKLFSDCKKMWVWD